MAATSFGVVYDAQEGAVRYVIVPDDDDELNDPSHVADGLTLLKLPLASYNDLRSPDDLAGLVAYVQSLIAPRSDAP